MTKRTSLLISTVFTVFLTAFFGVLTLSAWLGGSEEPDLGEGLGRALIMIFGIVALVYLGVNLIFKVAGAAAQNNILTVFVLLIDLVGIVALAALILDDPSAMIRAPFLEILPVLLISVAQIASVVFDILSFPAEKK